MSADVLDVAIVGGGVAGLYAGWSLLTRGAGGQAVRVFEGSGRTGGRLRTMVPPHAPHLRCELGGMRYIDTQALVVDLIAELGLPSRLFPVGDEHDLFYLRGKRWDLAALKSDPSVVPYELGGEERGRTPAELATSPATAPLVAGLRDGFADATRAGFLAALVFVLIGLASALRLPRLPRPGESDR